MDKIYYVIGRIVERTQVMEKNLEMVVKFSEVVGESERNPAFGEKDLKIAEESAEYLRNKMEGMTLGQRIYIICQTRCFSKQEADDLKKVLEKRNYFVHEYFKYTPFAELSSTELEDEFNALKTYFDQVNVLNKKIEIFKKSYEDKYNKLLLKFGKK